MQGILDFTIYDKMEEVWELVWGEERVDLHHKDLIILAKAFVDHIPDWMIDIIERDDIDFHCLEIRDIQQKKCIIICLMYYLDKHRRIFHWINEQAVN